MRPLSPTQKSVPVQVRLSPKTALRLHRLVEEANERAREARLPATVTASALLRMWIEEHLDDLKDVGEPERRTMSAPNVLEASAKLREAAGGRC